MTGGHNLGQSGAVYSVLSLPNHAGADQRHGFDRCAPDEPSELSAFLSWRPISKKMENDTGDVSKKRSVLVDVLAICFGIGTWLGVSGTYLQMPLVVKTAPEGWSLPSYLGIMVQTGNLGPLLYTMIQKYSRWKLNDGWTIHCVLAVGTLSSLFTAFFYDRTAYIAGKEHSVAFFVLTILTAFNACTSSVLFMPYMGRFKEHYMISYFIGEGLSGMLPSITALVQGIGEDKKCVLVNTTENKPIYEMVETPPLFDSKTFFLILFGMMVVSYIGYALLNHLRIVRREYAQMTVGKGNMYEYGQADHDAKLTLQKRGQYIGLLVLIGIISLFSNGMFPSILPYSSAPYGSQAYHLSATLTVIANPVACFLALFLHFTSLPIIYWLSGISGLLTCFVFTTAVMSPYPPLYDQTVGFALVVIAWTLLGGIVNYAKLGITTVMRAQGGQSLVWVGAITQLGSAIGAVAIFAAINYTNFFQDATADSDSINCS